MVVGWGLRASPPAPGLGLELERGFGLGLGGFRVWGLGFRG